jgi:hypothetical protein
MWRVPLRAVPVGRTSSLVAALDFDLRSHSVPDSNLSPLTFPATHSTAHRHKRVVDSVGGVVAAREVWNKQGHTVMNKAWSNVTELALHR